MLSREEPLVLLLEPEVVGLIGLGAVLPYLGEAFYRWARTRILHSRNSWLCHCC
jgi:hypothetical protein